MSTWPVKKVNETALHYTTALSGGAGWVVLGTYGTCEIPTKLQIR